MEHFPTIEAALEAVARDGRDVLVDFSGSDWCGWCIKLNEEVFDTSAWADAGARRFALVELDFPRLAMIPPEQRDYNRRMQALYGVEAFPTLFLLDSKGRAYARTGYEAGGPAAYLAHLESFAPRKAEIDSLPLPELLARVTMWEVGGLWIEAKRKFVERDPATPRTRKMLRELALEYHRRGHPAAHEAMTALLKLHDPAGADVIETALTLEREVLPLMQRREWANALAKLDPYVAKDGEAGQVVRYQAGVCEIRRGNLAACVSHLEKAIALAPESPMASAISRMLEQLKPV